MPDEWTIILEFLCKTAQLCATRYKWHCERFLSVRNGAQRSESKSKNSFLNYKSAALNQLSYPRKNTAHINGHCRVELSRAGAALAFFQAIGRGDDLPAA